MNLCSHLLFLSAHMILLVPPSLLCVSLSLFFVYSWLCWVVFFIAFYLLVCFLSWFGKYKFHLTRWASQVAQWKKNPSVTAGARGDSGSTPGSGRSPGGGHGNPLQLFLPGESHGQRSLADYSLWGHKESDMTE